MPPMVSFVEAATIPTVFLTAYSCLHDVVSISAASRALIHAATGGLQTPGKDEIFMSCPLKAIMQTSLVGPGHARASHALRSSRSQHLIYTNFTEGDLCGTEGGLGLAAVQLAKAAGANVLATAGSVQKRMHLREQGMQNVVSSRTLHFAEHFGSSKSAQPSIVLNSLTSPGSSSPFTLATAVESKRGCY